MASPCRTAVGRLFFVMAILATSANPVSWGPDSTWPIFVSGFCGMVKLEDSPGIDINNISNYPHETWFKFRRILMATLDSRGF